MIRRVENCRFSALGSASVVQEDESVLSVSGRQVVHHDFAGHTIKAWSFSEEQSTAPVLQALFVDFPDDKGSWLAVLVAPELLVLYGDDGFQVELPLPVAATSLRASSHGLLVVSSDNNSCTLSLSHPLDELKLVLCSDDTFLQDSVVFSHDSILVARSGQGTFSFWLAEAKNSFSNQHVTEEESAVHSEEDQTPDITHQFAVADFVCSRVGSFKSSSEALATFVLKERNTVCLVVEGSLRGFVINDRVGNEAFEISDCADAAPIVEPPHNVILLSRESDRSRRELHIYQGHVHVAKIFLPDSFFPYGSSIDITRFTHYSGRGSRLTIHGANEDEDVRVHFTMRSNSDAVQACLDSIESAVPSIGLAVRVSVLSEGGGWSAFSDVVHTLFGISHDVSSSSCRHQEDNVDQWSTLLTTDYHARQHQHRALSSATSGRCRLASLMRTDGVHEPCLTGERDHSRDRFKVGVLRNESVVDDTSLDSIALALHCVGEEWKLNVRMWKLVRPLEILLDSLYRNSPACLDRYKRNVLVGSTLTYQGNEILACKGDVHEWFSCIVKHGRCMYELEIPSPGFRTKQLKSIFEDMVENITSDGLVRGMVEHGIIEDEDLSTWPPGFALVFREALHSTRDSPYSSKSTAVNYFQLIGRQDLASCFTPRENDRTACISSKLRKGTSFLFESLSDDAGEFEEEEEFSIPNTEKQRVPNSGTCFHDNSSSTKEKRNEDVCRVLESSRPILLLVERPPEMSDHDFEQKKQEKLFMACLRSCAAPCGRAMLTLGSLGRPGSMTEALTIPPVCLSGRVPPSNAIISLDPHSIATLGTWLHFHNGVAAGLGLLGVSTDLSTAAHNASSCESHPVTRTWIAYNRPETPSAEHGGFLLALGLQKQLHVLTMTDVYEYLTLGHDPTTVGVLLGMAASKVGTGDTAVSKMLCLHIPALLPQPFAEMEVSATAQAAALTGIGLLYRGTGHRLMAEFLLREISRGIPGDRTRDREAYVLSAGIALGMVTLGSGASPEAAGLVDLRVSQRLHRAIAGGRERSRDGGREFQRRELNDCGKADFLGFGDILSSSGGCASTCPTRQSTFLTKTRRDSNNMSSRINEGDFVNTAVSAPGATLALGLFFLQTNCRSTAKQIDLPDTHVLLNSLRPDFLLLRVIARSMILWNDVTSSRQWVEKQVPLFIQNSIEHIRRGGVKRSRLIDWESIKQAHANVIAGACFSVGLRYAGTSSPSAAETLQYYLKHFKMLRSTNAVANLDAAIPTEKPDTADVKKRTIFSTTPETEALAFRMDRTTVDMALSAVAISLGMVMAGTRDATSLGLLLDVRRRVDKDTTFGTHQAIHCAIGLLFLGGGQASLSRSKEAIAALACAFFPRYPRTADDNQHHLQASRHLWLLAVEWRGLETMDVNLGKVTPVPLQIGLKDDGIDWTSPGTVLKVIAPCLAPPLCDIAWIRVVSMRYYYIELDLAKSTHSRVMPRLKLFVKRRTGHLSHVQDPPSVNKARPLEHCVIAESVPGCSVGDKTLMCAEVIAPYVDDASMWIFARFFCADLVSSSFSSPNLRPLGGVPGGCTRHWNAQALFECISADKQHILSLYLRLHQYAQQLKTCAGKSQMQQIWSLRLALDFYDRDSCLIKHLRFHTVTKAQLVRPSFIESIRVHLHSFFGDKEEAKNQARGSSLLCTSKKSPGLGNASSKGQQAVMANILLPAFLRDKERI